MSTRNAVLPDDVRRFGDSGAAATATLLVGRDAEPGTAVASLLAPSRAIVTLHPSTHEADR